MNAHNQTSFGSNVVPLPQTNRAFFSELDVCIASFSLAQRYAYNISDHLDEGSLSVRVGQQKGWLDDDGNFTEAGKVHCESFNLTKLH